MIKKLAHLFNRDSKNNRMAQSAIHKAEKNFERKRRKHRKNKKKHQPVKIEEYGV